MEKKIVVLATVGIIFAGMVTMAIPASAGTRYDTIQKGQTKDYMIDPGNSQNPSLEVLYSPNGQGAVRLEWRQPWRTYIAMEQPMVATVVYWSRTGEGDWRYIYQAPCNPSWHGTTGWLQVGVYKIKMICYSEQGARVKVRVR